MAKGRYILLLNSDTAIEADTLNAMIEFMYPYPTIGAAGCKVVLPDGLLDKACKRGFLTSIDLLLLCFRDLEMVSEQP